MKKQKKEKKIKKVSKIRSAAASVCPRLTLECLDRYEILLGGCQKIESFKENEICILTSSCKIRILGQGITLSSSGDKKILICGKFSSIEFV